MVDPGGREGGAPGGGVRPEPCYWNQAMAVARATHPMVDPGGREPAQQLTTPSRQELLPLAPEKQVVKVKRRPLPVMGPNSMPGEDACISLVTGYGADTYWLSPAHHTAPQHLPAWTGQGGGAS
ncbi:hypothetical protein HaLaN_23476 [Haematococcus lacustris]|uniref:Uncharacterized protein n=1 Tax=Haematococcus lacustris TaxID=44745 RepID=A0A6A0A260_HAELA|nr:hypothetical protein HaLaN_23476 [Haematococcus lacustris]